jgi:hypothetical protein
MSFRAPSVARSQLISGQVCFCVTRLTSSAGMPFSLLLQQYASQFKPVSRKSFSWGAFASSGCPSGPSSRGGTIKSGKSYTERSRALKHGAGGSLVVCELQL